MSNRIKGRQLMLEIDGVDHWADASSVLLDREDKDSNVVTFEDASKGTTQQEFFSITAIQSTDPTSLWSYVWDHSGETVPFTYAPHGNEEPTTAKPHFVGMLTIGPRPALGGEAGRDVEFTFETRWDIEGTVVKDTGE